MSLKDFMAVPMWNDYGLLGEAQKRKRKLLGMPPQLGERSGTKYLKYLKYLQECLCRIPDARLEDEKGTKGTRYGLEPWARVQRRFDSSTTIPVSQGCVSESHQRQKHRAPPTGRCDPQARTQDERWSSLRTKLDGMAQTAKKGVA